MCHRRPFCPILSQFLDRRAMKVLSQKHIHEDSRCNEMEARLMDPHQSELHDDLETIRGFQRSRAERGERVYDLSMVNPDLSPPRAVLDRLLESVTKTSNHRYAVSRGVRRLREAFGAKYRTKFNQEIDSETQVCVCLGSKDATFHALRVLIATGDSVVVPYPAYPAHPSAVSLVGGTTVPWKMHRDPAEAGDSLAQVLQQSRAKVLLLNLPSNPEGIAVSAAWWESVGAVCARYGVTIVNDFVYGEMVFGGAPAVSALVSAMQGARCVEVYSLSKAYNVPGWRVGALVGNESVVRAVARLKSHADYGLFLPLQYAAAQALTSNDDLVRPTVQTYERRLKVLGAGLQGLGWHIENPEAGACLWAKYPVHLAALSNGSRFRSVNATRYLLDSIGLVVTPGVVFGDEGDEWVRLAAVVNEERIRDVLGALRSLGQQNSELVSGA